MTNKQKLLHLFHFQSLFNQADTLAHTGYAPELLKCSVWTEQKTEEAKRGNKAYSLRRSRWDFLLEIDLFLDSDSEEQGPAKSQSCWGLPSIWKERKHK